jgi:hypothetical protein
MTIKNKHNGILVYPAIVYRKGDKCVKFSGVTIKIDSNNFRKHWEIV